MMKEYLGDSVYVNYIGDHIILTTENGIETDNTIYLDQGVIRHLVEYIRNNNL